MKSTTKILQNVMISKSSIRKIHKIYTKYSNKIKQTTLTIVLKTCKEKNLNLLMKCINF